MFLKKEERTTDAASYYMAVAKSSAISNLNELAAEIKKIRILLAEFSSVWVTDDLKLIQYGETEYIKKELQEKEEAFYKEFVRVKEKYE